MLAPELIFSLSPTIATSDRPGDQTEEATRNHEGYQKRNQTGRRSRSGVGIEREREDGKRDAGEGDKRKSVFTIPLITLSVSLLRRCLLAREEIERRDLFCCSRQEDEFN